jgi:nicotinamidase/pyrazinamidase
MKALLILTLQNDFCSFGNTSVESADALSEKANLLMPIFDCTVAVNYAFPPNHLSFAANHLFRQPGKSMMINGKEQLLKPIHCVEGSYGAEFPAGLQKNKIDYTQKVGMQIERDVYSLFRDSESSDNELVDYLKNKAVKELYFMGISSNFLVQSLSDAIERGFLVYVIKDACAGKSDFSLFNNIVIDKLL